MVVSKGNKVKVDGPVQLRVQRLGDAAAEAFQPSEGHPAAEGNVLKLVERPILAPHGDDLHIGREVEAGEEDFGDFGGGFIALAHGEVGSFVRE